MGKKPTIQRIVDGKWEVAAFEAPPAAVEIAVSAKENKPMQEPTTKNLSILFMDLSGWSKLKPAEIALYLEKGLPKLSEKVLAHKSDHLNTWGDALVATFDSARTAAECALDIRDVFRRASNADGVPAGLRPRVSLHVGEVIIAWNPLTQAEDVFGDAVHLAARLEPMTWKGHVFCTEEFATALRAVKGLGATAHPADSIVLPKDYGTVNAFVVTGPGEDAPQNPNPQPESAPAPPTPPAAVVEPEAIKMMLTKWLIKQAEAHTDVAKGHPILFRDIDQQAGVPAGAAEAHIASVYGDRWTETKRGGGFLILSKAAARVLDMDDVFGPSGSRGGRI